MYLQFVKNTQILSVRPLYNWNRIDKEGTIFMPQQNGYIAAKFS